MWQHWAIKLNCLFGSASLTLVVKLDDHNGISREMFSFIKIRVFIS